MHFPELEKMHRSKCRQHSIRSTKSSLREKGRERKWCWKNIVESKTVVQEVLPVCEKWFADRQGMFRKRERNASYEKILQKRNYFITGWDDDALYHTGTACHGTGESVYIHGYPEACKKRTVYRKWGRQFCIYDWAASIYKGKYRHLWKFIYAWNWSVDSQMELHTGNQLGIQYLQYWK